MNETLTIERCPLCKESHTYDLEIVRDEGVGLGATVPELHRTFTCPVKGVEFKATITRSNIGVEVKNIAPLSFHDRTIQQTGAKLILESLETTRDVCKFLATASTGAIPFYVGLLALVLPDDYRVRASDGVFLFLPVAGFLISAVLSVKGLLPTPSSISLDILGEVRNERMRLISWRMAYARPAGAVFALSLLAALAAVIIATAVQYPVPAATLPSGA